jgi:hypothetical protein
MLKPIKTHKYLYKKRFYNVFNLYCRWLLYLNPWRDHCAGTLFPWASLKPAPAAELHSQEYLLYCEIVLTAPQQAADLTTVEIRQYVHDTLLPVR